MLIALLLIPLAFASNAQQIASTPVFELPGPTTRLPSPDKKWTLVFEARGEQRRLWIEDNASHARKLVHVLTRSAGVSWAPDGRSFFLNDELGSDGADCYVIDASTLKETNVASLLVAHFTTTLADYFDAGHVYVEGIRWLTSRVLLVRLTGHLDRPPQRAFTFRFEVDLNGAVRKVAESRKEEH